MAPAWIVANAHFKLAFPNEGPSGFQNTVWTIIAVIGESKNVLSRQPIISLNVRNNQTGETHLMAVSYYGNSVMAKITDGPAYYDITPVTGGGKRSRKGRKMKRRTMKKVRTVKTVKK